MKFSKKFFKNEDFNGKNVRNQRFKVKIKVFNDGLYLDTEALLIKILIILSQFTSPNTAIIDSSIIIN